MTDFQTAAQMTGRPFNRKVAVLGPSHVDQMSIGKRLMAHGAMTYAGFTSRQRWLFDPSLEFGVNGDLPTAGTASNGTAYPGILNRLVGPVDAAFGAVPQNLLATSDFGAILLVGIFANYWGLAGASGAGAIAIAQQIQNAIIAAGRLPVWVTEYPTGDSANIGQRVPSALLPDAMRLVGWQQAQRSVPGVLVIDSAEALANRGSSVGDILTGYTRDGRHLNQAGARRLGRLISRCLDTVFEPVSVLPRGNADVFSAANPTGSLSANPYFTGTAGSLNGMSGVVADGWAFVTNTSGITLTGAKVAGATGFNGTPYADQESKDWQQVTIGGTATNTDDVVLLAQTVSSNITVGDVLRAVAELEIDSLVNISKLSLAVYGATSTSLLAEFFSGTTEIDAFAMLNVPDQGVALTPLTEPVTATSARIQIRAKAAAAGAVSGVFRIRGAALLKG